MYVSQEVLGLEKVDDMEAVSAVDAQRNQTSFLLILTLHVYLIEETCSSLVLFTIIPLEIKWIIPHTYFHLKLSLQCTFEVPWQPNQGMRFPVYHTLFQRVL